MKNLKILFMGMPGIPIFEIGEALSAFHEMNFFVIEENSEYRKTYFQDKIPAKYLDTGDFTSGSASSHMSRDISSVEKDIEMDSIYVPNVQKNIDLNKIRQIFTTESGILVSEIPDLTLLNWATHICIFKVNFDIAINWFAKRRKCPACGNVHHTEDKPPIMPGICDRCGTRLIRKPEDDPKITSQIYQNWRKTFVDFEKKMEKKKNWKIIQTDKYKNFEEILNATDKWLKKNGIGIPPINHTIRTDNKGWA